MTFLPRRARRHGPLKRLEQLLPPRSCQSTLLVYSFFRLRPAKKKIFAAIFEAPRQARFRWKILQVMKFGRAVPYERFGISPKFLTQFLEDEQATEPRRE